MAHNVGAVVASSSSVCVRRYTVKLWLRPDVYVVIKHALMKHEEKRMLITTLREAGHELSA